MHRHVVFWSFMGALAALVVVLGTSTFVRQSEHAPPAPHDAQMTTKEPPISTIATADSTARQGSPSSFPIGDVTISAAPMFGLRGAINLPNGTLISIRLDRPKAGDADSRLAQGLPACDPDCMPFDGEATVQSGQFLIHPFTGREEQIQPYNYPVTIVIEVNQPPEVKTLIGDAGQNISGPNVHYQRMPDGGVAVTSITTHFDNATR